MFIHITHYKDIPSAGLLHGPINTRLLATFNIDTMEETWDSTNHMIIYNTLREIKVHIKHREIHEDSSLKEEWENEPEEE